MRGLINYISMVLNHVKCLVVGTSVSASDQMMIDYKGKRYMVTFEELCDAWDEKMLETMKKYWGR